MDPYTTACLDAYEADQYAVYLLVTHSSDYTGARDMADTLIAKAVQLGMELGVTDSNGMAIN